MSQRFSSTVAVHGWRLPSARDDDRSPRPLLTPIVQSATFAQREPGAAQEYTYSRASNPTVAALERALGALEDAPPAVAFASGLAATHALALAFLKAGDHAVVSRACYGGTARLFREILAPLGISTSFVDASDVAAVARALTARTRLILVETPANPTLELVDLDALARLSRSARVALAVDNTFLTAVLQRPLAFGADVTLLSTTKWIDGHNATIGGALVARDEALLERLRFLRKSLGSIQAPFDAWLTLQGLKTLPLRLKRHSESAHALAHWLDGRAGVSRVFFPGLVTNPQSELARRQHLGGHGGVVTFELEGGRSAALAFARRLEIVTLAESLGGVESLLTHPATMTHGDVPLAQRAEIGLTDGLLRLSVGLEDVDDLKRDLALALDACVAEGVACGEHLFGRRPEVRELGPAPRGRPRARRARDLSTRPGRPARRRRHERSARHDRRAPRPRCGVRARRRRGHRRARGAGRTGERGAARARADRAGVRATVAPVAALGITAEGDPLDADVISIDAKGLDALLRQCGVVVVPGFLGADASGRTVLLGRGGSDLTALVIAHALKAECVLLKDVDGLHPPEEASSRYETLHFDDAVALEARALADEGSPLAQARRQPFLVRQLLGRDGTRVGDVATRLAPRVPIRRARVALLGLGVVGRGVFERLLTLSDRFELVGVAVRHVARHAASGVPAELLTSDAASLARRAEIVIEVMGGLWPASAIVDESLQRGAHVVTANKSLVAAKDRSGLRHSAAVGGAAPCLELLRRLTRDPCVTREFEGVVNATTNVILDWQREGSSFDAALALARERGYAEADPSADIDGIDCAEKVRLLCRAAFGRDPDSLEFEGIRDLDARDRTWRLVVRATNRATIVARVRPEPLAPGHRLADVSGAWNRLVVHTNDDRAHFAEGKGAGRWPTTEAVIADALDAHAALTLEGIESEVAA